jgi:hypothetical protein
MESRRNFSLETTDTEKRPFPCPRGLRRRSTPLGYWDRGLESSSGHGRLSLCFCVVLYSVGTGLCDGPIISSEESYRVSK